MRLESQARQSGLQHALQKEAAATYRTLSAMRLESQSSQGRIQSTYMLPSSNQVELYEYLLKNGADPNETYAARSQKVLGLSASDMSPNERYDRAASYRRITTAPVKSGLDLEIMGHSLAYQSRLWVSDQLFIDGSSFLIKSGLGVDSRDGGELLLIIIFTTVRKAVPPTVAEFLISNGPSLASVDKHSRGALEFLAGSRGPGIISRQKLASRQVMVTVLPNWSSVTAVARRFALSPSKAKAPYSPAARGERSEGQSQNNQPMSKPATTLILAAFRLASKSKKKKVRRHEFRFTVVVPRSSAMPSPSELGQVELKPTSACARILRDQCCVAQAADGVVYAVQLTGSRFLVPEA
ncbi:hypothetical protein B0T24DRAFT_694955 [Lasiosphaeria ovina]|uniref:Ankyrin repeat protein n=1 Tax=Lasiosphaeria ovina TaxID=92902 RepID=A0AAE0KNT6_9PEZI|nr:hypothetical protein B0T24DRAFT_694955 [Lasiosphaeria ovina]